MKAVEGKIKDENFLQLKVGSRDVSNHIAGYISFKDKKTFSCGDNCGDNLLTTDGDQKNLSSRYTVLLSRGGLLTPRKFLSEAVAKSFALLGRCSTTIADSKLPSTTAGLFFFT